MNKNQLEAFEKFKKLKVGALFMEMGTGKTRVALELVNYNNVDLLIYVTPFSTLKNIEDEIKKWGVNCEYILIGYETISSSDRKYLELLDETKSKKCFIIADESIFIKNEETKRFNRLCNIRNQCEYALILNGTPLTKNEWDLYNQMYFLSPLILNMSRDEFLNTFFTKISYKRKYEEPHTFYKLSEINAEALKKMIKPYIFDAKLDFDKKIDINYIKVKIDLTEYNHEKGYWLSMIEKNLNADVILTMLTKLNIISSLTSEKNFAIKEYVKNRQVIVYCNYLEEVDALSQILDCFVITGETKNRNEIIEQFKNSNKPLVMTYGTGAYSLNLQFCNEIVYSSLNFDYAKYEQSKFRIKRIGQEKDIKYTYILSDTGINKFILSNLDKKRNLAEIIKEKLAERGIEKWLKNI